jgi:hypothetical protein
MSSHLGRLVTSAAFQSRHAVAATKQLIIYAVAPGVRFPWV